MGTYNLFIASHIVTGILRSGPEVGLGVCFIIFHFILKRLHSQTLYLNVQYVYIFVQYSIPEASK